MTHMRRVRTMTCVLAATTLIAAMFSAGVFATSADERRKIVRFRPVTTSLSCSLLRQCLDLTKSEDMTEAIAEITKYGGKVLHRLPLINALAVEFPEGGLLTTVTSLLNDSLYVVEVIDDLLTWVDPICPTTAVPLTESYRWGMEQIEVPAVHDRWHGVLGSGVTVAVLDTGIDPTHLEFDWLTPNPRVATGYNALAGEGSYLDDHGHGTHMAGIIAAAWDGLGIIGVAPQATLAAVKVLDSTGHGYLSDVVNGLQWVYDQNMNKPVTDQIRLVNMSFGFSIDSTPLGDAIQSLWSSGVIMVASAGNRCAAAPITEDGGGDGECLGGGPAPSCQPELNAIMYPAAYGSETRVIAVGATDRHDHVTAYSLSGPQLLVMAPGGDREIGAEDNGQILSTNKLGSYGRGHGTSQAAAHVTGAIALVLQLQPTYSFVDVRDLLKKTTVELSDPKDRQGEGRIDVEQMMEELLP